MGLAKWLLIVAVCGVMAGVTTSNAAAQDGKPPAAKTPIELPMDLKGMVLVVSAKSDASTGACIKDAAIRTLLGQNFLVGTATASGYPGDWQKGRPVWLAIDDIAQMVVFPDEKTYLKTFEESQRGAREELFELE